MERRLAAILAADVVGYSRLVRADEEGTIAALVALRTNLVEPRIASHNGRIVKLMGDGMLAEFPSVVDAVRAAIEAQQAIADHNTNMEEERTIAFRVGINLGDVMVTEDNLFGDAVNIAARLEAAAQPEGICVSQSVFDMISQKIMVSFEDAGKLELKNIERPSTGLFCD